MKKKHIIMIVLALLLLVALFQIDTESLLHSFSQIPLWLILVLVALQIVSQLLINLQWHIIAKLAGTPISFRDMMYVNCQGAVVDSITPGVKIGGEVTRAVQISRIGNCAGEQSAAVVALQKLFSLSALFFILLFAVGYLVGEVSWLSTRFTQILVFGVLLVFLLFFLGIFIVPHHIKNYMQAKKDPRFLWMRKVRVFFHVLLTQVGNVRKNTKTLVMLLLLSLFIWLLYPAKMYILAVQFFPGAGIIHVAAITFTAYMVAMLPIFPGGLGGFEGTMSGLLAAMGFAISDAAVITIFFRFITFWLVMILGLFFITFYKTRKSVP